MSSSFHFSHDTDGGIATVHNSSEDAFYLSDASFGAGNSITKWILLYTCNFINTNVYQTNDDLTQMMDIPITKIVMK